MNRLALLAGAADVSINGATGRARFSLDFVTQVGLHDEVRVEMLVVRARVGPRAQGIVLVWGEIGDDVAAFLSCERRTEIELRFVEQLHRQYDHEVSVGVVQVVAEDISFPIRTEAVPAVQEPRSLYYIRTRGAACRAVLNARRRSEWPPRSGQRQGEIC